MWEARRNVEACGKCKRNGSGGEGEVKWRSEICFSGTQLGAFSLYLRYDMKRCA